MGDGAWCVLLGGLWGRLESYWRLGLLLGLLGKVDVVGLIERSGWAGLLLVTYWREAGLLCVGPKIGLCSLRVSWVVAWLRGHLPLLVDGMLCGLGRLPSLHWLLLLNGVHGVVLWWVIPSLVVYVGGV